MKKKLLHYEILHRIGKGGMGEVYSARDTKLGREVALKVLPSEMAADPERRQRFEREAKAVASLQHPHIVTIHSIEEAEGTHFLTMEIVRGKTLHEVIPKDGVTLDQLFEIGIPLADAVHAAHEQGVIHRDLKPGNVMIDDAGHLKVLDFGLSKLLTVAEDGADAETMAAQDSTQDGRVLGTVAYMSPEQAEGKELDRRSDIFSLGILLYEAATGKRPFTGDTPISTMSAILRETPPSVTSLKPLPRHLGRIIQRCLEKNPDKRFQTARDVGNALEGLQKEVDSGEVEPASGVSGSAMTPAARPGLGRRKLVWLVPAAVAVVAAIALYVTVSNRTSGAPGGATGTSIRPLTGTVGMAGDANWSPDGNFFAYSHSANGPADIFIRATAGGDPVRLVESPYDDESPVWSPDNRWIAFLSGQENGRGALYLVPPLGGAIRRLTGVGFERLDNMGGWVRPLGPSAWSPDGERLVFARMHDGLSSLWTIDLATGRETRLTQRVDASDGGASWSPDGRQIAFFRMTGEGRSLWTVPADGGEERRILPGDDFWFMTTDWSPDSRSIVFLSPTGDHGVNLLSVDVDSGALRRLTSGTSSFTAACVGRDGRILVNDFRHQTDLYLQQIDSGDARRLTFNTGTNFCARVAPQGDRVAYHSDRTGNNDIWVLDLESGRELQVTDREGYDSYPCWSPDGKTIIFSAGYPSSSVLSAVDAVGGALRPLFDGEDTGLPRWSPDGSTIGVLSLSGGASSLWLLDPDGSRPRMVMEGVSDFGWYRDSRRVIYTPAAEQATQIRAFDLETGQDALVLDEPHIELAVADDGSALTYCSATSHYNMNLHLLRLEPGEDGLPRAVGEPIALTAGDGEWHVHNGGFTPDGESVVYTRDTDTGNIYLVEGAFAGVETAR
jgi:Tol biopolymer transport system component